MVEGISIVREGAVSTAAANGIVAMLFTITAAITVTTTPSAGLRVCPNGPATCAWKSSIRRLDAQRNGRLGGKFQRHPNAGGHATSSTVAVPSLIETNVLVYRFDAG